MNSKELWQKNRGEFYSVDGSFRIQYFIDRRGLSAWIISTRRSNGFYFAVDHASTFDNARAKYFELVKEVA
jgi:hypothetical protein